MKNTIILHTTILATAMGGALSFAADDAFARGSALYPNRALTHSPQAEYVAPALDAIEAGHSADAQTVPPVPEPARLPSPTILAPSLLEEEPAEQAVPAQPDPATHEAPAPVTAAAEQPSQVENAVPNPTSAPEPETAPEPAQAAQLPEASAEPPARTYGIFDYLADQLKKPDRPASTPKQTAHSARPSAPAASSGIASNAEKEVETQTAAASSSELTAKPDAEPTAEPAIAPRPLDAATLRILARIPRSLGEEALQPISKAELERYDPEIAGILGGDTSPSDEEAEDVSRHESLGVAIEIRRPKLDVNEQLQTAYDALTFGKPHLAIEAYKNILRQYSRQQDALFGLATTFHRQGEFDKARPFYVRLLQLNPKHREGLGNFLALVAQEAPQEVVQQLELLAQRNPGFSPIAAQLASLYDSLDMPERAVRALFHAIELAPDNLAYKYNLAVLYDKYGHVKDATLLYNELLSANRAGHAIPADARSLQERVIYINSHKS